MIRPASWAVNQGKQINCRLYRPLILEAEQCFSTGAGFAMQFSCFSEKSEHGWCKLIFSAQILVAQFAQFAQFACFFKMSGLG
jgi:hypothetical protein